MCKYYVSKCTYKCGQAEDVWVRIERCEEAEEHGSDCPSDDMKRQTIGSPKRRDDCERYNDEGYSRT